MKIEGVDLNLLVAFEALYRERNVTRAAARVGRSQPALSSALARLRQLFGDPLFQRGPRGVEPTARAEALATPIAEALRQARLAVEGPVRFDPGSAELTFLLGGSEYTDHLVLPRLLALAGARAPLVAFSVRRTPFLFEPPQADLTSGRLDAALGFFPVRYAPHTGLRAAQLWTEQFVGLLRRRHPRLRRRLDLAAVLALGHVRIVYGEGPGTSMLDGLLATRGERRRVAVTVAHLASVAEVVACTDLLGFLPRRLAERARRRLPVAPVPVALSLSDTPLVMVWHERAERDPAQVWLRGLVREACRSGQEIA